MKLLKKDMEDHLESCEHRMMECELCEERMKVMEAEVSVSFSLFGFSTCLELTCRFLVSAARFDMSFDSYLLSTLLSSHPSVVRC